MPFIQISYYKMNENTIKVTSISNEVVVHWSIKCIHGVTMERMREISGLL